jgi:hypothetical protein
VALLGSAESGGEAAHDQDHELLVSYQSLLKAANHEDATHRLVQNFERLDPGVVARPMLDRLTPEPGFTTLVALHHPISSVAAVEVGPYTGIVNAGQVRRALVKARTALALHGHTHLTFLSAERLLNNAPDWTLRIAGAATLASTTSDEQSGYNEIFIAREGGEHGIAVRPVRLDGGQWSPGPEIAFHPGAPAECTIGELTHDRRATGNIM